MTKLTETQTLLLTTAANRANGNLLPLPETPGKISTGLRRSIATLITRSFVAEIDAAADDDSVWRREGDHVVGLVITDAGRSAIGAPIPVVPTATASTSTTKIGLVTDLLRRADGATLIELIAATGWLPHTTRAALTGLRKKGHNIDKATRGGATAYMIAAA